MTDKRYEKCRKQGKIIYKILKILMKTIKVVKVEEENYNQDENYIYAFWHQKIIFPTVTLTNVEKKTTLVSPSRDGEIMTSILEEYGYEVIRGSSRDQNIRSLVSMMKKLKAGYSLGFAVDGPQGPPFIIKPGIIYMAIKSGKKIVPVGGAFKKKHVFEKAWDKFHFPYPFTKAAVVLGNPIEIPKDSSQEEWIEVINEKINEVNKKAEVLLNG